MADEKVTVTYTIRDLASSATNGLRTAFQNLAKLGLTPAVLGIGAIVAGLKLATEKMGENQERVTELNQALMNNGMYTTKVSNALQDYAKEIQKKTIYDDEAAIRAEALFLSYGLQADQVKKLTMATANFASVKKMDLGEAAMLVARSVGTETNALARSGIALNGAAGSTERVNSALEGMARWTGFAESNAGTFVGSMKQLKNAMDDFWESLGYALTGGGKAGLIHVLTMIVNKADEFVQNFGIGLRVIMVAIQNLGDIWQNSIAQIPRALQKALHLSTAYLDKQIEDRMKAMKARTKELNEYITRTQKDRLAVDNGIQKQQDLTDEDAARKKKEQAIQDAIEIRDAIIQAQKESGEAYYKLNKERIDREKAFMDYFKANQSDLVNSWKIGANAIVDVEKKKFIAILQAWMLQQQSIAWGELAMLNPHGLLTLAGVGAAGVGVSLIDSIKLAQGGSMVVDSPTRIGNNVIAGEAGPERITVTPLNKSGNGTGSINLSVHIGNDRLIKKTLKTGQAMRSERILDDGININ